MLRHADYSHFEPKVAELLKQTLLNKEHSTVAPTIFSSISRLFYLAEILCRELATVLGPITLCTLIMCMKPFM